MSSPCAPAAVEPAHPAGPLRRQRAAGERAVVVFRPTPTSDERLCAGVVVRLEDGRIDYRCAVDRLKAEHAFGQAGAAIAGAAEGLCQSLAEHWLEHPNLADWTPPFEGARIAEQTRFTAKNAESAIGFALRTSSSLYELLSGYEIPPAAKTSGTVTQRVKSALSKNERDKHLSRRFNRELNIGAEAAPLRVDFLGQNFACYFIQASSSPRGIDQSAERAFGKLYELQALRKLLSTRRKSLGLFEDERPSAFELLVLGNREHPVQRRAIAQIEALADRDRVRMRTLDSVTATAEHVAHMERKFA